MELAGIICFMGDGLKVSKTELIHYQTYIISTDKQKWFVYDDLNTDSQILMNPPMEKIALILYVEV